MSGRSYLDRQLGSKFCRMSGYETYFADYLSGSIQSGQFLWALLAACFGGLLTSFTPCVYPLIPITIRFFGGMQNEKRSHVVRLAVFYVLGMMFLYTILGTIFASLNLVFGSFLAHKGVLWGIVILCMAMGVSMLGGFSLQLPAALNTRASQIGNKSLGGAFAMGMVSGLIAAPCTGPVLAVILTLIASTGEVVYGFFFMVAFSSGLGLPFLVLALSSTALQKVPGSGRWMELVKIVLASAMFIVAAYFMRFAWPGMTDALAGIPQTNLVLTILLLATGGCILLLLKTHRSEVEFRAMWGSTFCLSLAIILGLWGQASEEKTIAWYTNHDQALAEALKAKMPVMIDFTAEWCQACKELDEKTYTAPSVMREAERFISLKVDSTDMDDEVNRLFEKYNILGLPTVLFIDSSGEPIDDPRVTGFVEADRFLLLMQKIK
ncbi:MAG: hypothetical protein CMH60_05845 [Myxococcales bacterium]|nr:hypothetical protein [Myxococcales bacterium]